MDNLVATLTNTQFLIAVLAAVAAAAVVFSIGATFFSGGSQMRQRIKRVALEREKMRAEEMARLRGGGGGADLGGVGRSSGPGLACLLMAAPLVLPSMPVVR